MPAVDAAVEVRPEQGVGGHAPVADRQQIVLVAVSFRADGQAGEVDLVLPSGRHPQDLQLVEGHARKLERAQALGLLCQSVQDVHPGDAQRHLPKQVAPCIRLRGAWAARPGPSGTWLLTNGLVGARLASEQHGGRGAHGEGAGGQDVPQVEGTVEDVFGQEGGEWFLNVGVDVAVGVIDVRTAPQLPKVVHGLGVFGRSRLGAHCRVDSDCTNHLDRQSPEVSGRILVAPLDHGVVRELLYHLQREVRPLRLLVGVQGVVEAVVQG
mmetsp:Transcript_17321/g.52185  ORF Transcript_17321/g.52185 Transcript_17321/m.52185 type:complete len:267 (-) Transcript_17321:466-1266(-)